MFDMFDGLEINLIRPITGSPNGLSVFFVLFCSFLFFFLTLGVVKLSFLLTAQVAHFWAFLRHHILKSRAHC